MSDAVERLRGLADDKGSVNGCLSDYLLPVDNSDRELLRAAADVVDVLENRQGCNDSSCHIRKPTGMVTNGGCRCLRGVNGQRFLHDLNVALDRLEGTGEGG